MKKLSVLIGLILVFYMIPAFASADANDVVLEYPHRYGEESSFRTLEKSVDLGKLRGYLFDEFSKCLQLIDLRSFNISATNGNIEALKEFIWQEMSESFHVNGVGIGANSGRISKIAISYQYTEAEYAQKYAQLQIAIHQMVADIKDNHKLTDVQKALLLHDRLALVCQYDYNDSADRHSAYGALINGAAVCEGYTHAYSMLLDAVGIENYCCYSEQLNHIWNIVYIDNLPYHVDVTWDDYPWDTGQRGVLGMVDHKNFLRSSHGIYSAGHEANDFDDRPTSTIYDNYFWQTSRSAFQLVNDKLYYIDNEAKTLKQYGSSTALCSVSDTWRYTGSLVWPTNYSRLASDGTDLIYSLADAVYKYDVTTQTSTKIFAPDLSANNSIFGFVYANGYLICDINYAPPYTGILSDLYQTQKFYDAQPPVGSVTSTNDVAPKQTVTIRMSDNVGIAGYYWGTSSIYSNNAYTVTDSTSVTKQISGSGTYYLTVKDRGGNVSQTKKITFYKTTLNGNGASVAPSYIITADGKSFHFPTASQKGYTYKGWATTTSAASGITGLTPTKNTTYYPVMEFTYTGLLKVSGKWYYLRSGAIATDYTGLVKWEGQWWYVIQGRVATDTTNLIKWGGEWWYVINGKVASNTTNLIKYNGEWFYVVKGKVASNTTTLVKYNGAWYYIYKGKLAGNTTNLIKYNGEWWYVVKGKIASNTTTLIDYNGGRYYIYKGKLAAQTTTLVKYNGVWYYVRSGKVDYSYNGVVKFSGGYYNVRNGRVV